MTDNAALLIALTVALAVLGLLALLVHVAGAANVVPSALGAFIAVLVSRSLRRRAH